MQENRVFEVSQINLLLENILKNNFDCENAYIIGEVHSRITPYSAYSGMVICYYLSLKDKSENEKTEISCVILRDDYNKNLTENALIKAKISKIKTSKKVNIQLYLKDIEILDKEGEYKRQIEELKNKLQKEGLFTRKREINPLRVKNICVITSLKGAVIKDIIKNIRHKNKYINIYAIDCRVQGDTAAKTIKDAVELANKVKDIYKLDVLIIGRGGGSLTDLMPYSDEQLMYSVYSSEIPTISAVGHEENNPILDYVADKRCSVPAEVAKIVTIDQNEIKEAYINLLYEINEITLNKINLAERSLKSNLDSIFGVSKAQVETRIEKVSYLLRENTQKIENKIVNVEREIRLIDDVIKEYDSKRILKRGYSLALDLETEKPLEYKDLKKGKLIKVIGSNYQLKAYIEDFTNLEEK